MSFLLNFFEIKKSTFYYNNRLFFSLNFFNSSNSNRRGFSFTVSGSTFSDSDLYELFNKLYSIDDPNDPYYYVRTLGSKKISAFLRNDHGIIVNHKKVHSIRKELGYVRAYVNHFKHPKKRPNNHEVTRPNQFFEADIKFIPANNKYIPLLDVIDVFDKNIVGSFIGDSCKSKDFISTLKSAFEFRNLDPSNLTIRTDNGPQFVSKLTKDFMNEFNVSHEFGYKNNPNSQAFIESHHSSVEREFVSLNPDIQDTEDAFLRYKAYLYFYHYLRPHGSLNYMTPASFHDSFNHDSVDLFVDDLFSISVKK